MGDQSQVDDHLSELAIIAVEPQRTCLAVSVTPPVCKYLTHCVMTCANVP